jgi:hypothetical protein
MGLNAKRQPFHLAIGKMRKIFRSQLALTEED